MRTLLFTGLFSVLHLLSGSAANAAINGSDDFNDNLKDEAKWAPDRSVNGGLLTETGGHIEYTSNGIFPTQFGYRPWQLNKATYATNWEVIVDLTNTATPTVPDTSASMGIEIFAAGSAFSKSAYVELYASKDEDAPVERGFATGLVDGENYTGDTASITTATTGSVRVSFNAVTKVLTFYRDPDGPAGGYTWTQQASYGIAGSGGANGNASWGLAGSAELTVNIYGYSEFFATPAGTVSADNFAAFSGTSVTTNASTDVTGTSAVLNGTIYPSGLNTTVVFDIATDEDFLEAETTAPQLIPGTASSMPFSAAVSDLTLGFTYWVRARATNSAGTFIGNTIVFSLPPYTLTVNPTIGSVSTNPLAPNYPAGATVTLTATPPPGSTFVSWTGDTSGTQNPLTLTMNANKNVIANFTLPIPQAADTSLTFTGGGAKPWFGQTATSHDGVDAVQSGAIADNETSWFQTTVNGAGQLSFWLKISSESNDFFEFFVDNVRQESSSGNIDWQKRTYNLGAGTHTFRWQYRKDFNLIGGADAAWVDEITFTPSMDFNAWRATKFTTEELADTAISGTAADPDSDGVSNLMEFALGGQPKDNASRILPDVHVEAIGGENYLTLTIVKPTNLSGITYTPQVCGDLNSWLGGSPNVVTMTNTTTTLKVRDSIPISSSRSRFIRLLVAN